jgi:hypothetical protein
MNAFKKKALISAVVAGFGFAGAAQAVYLNPSGLGSGLIYPYYTVQSVDGNAYNTAISVVNTTDVVKVVKVRFREGKASKEVLDFNLYLSPNDVWTGVVIPSSDAAGAVARLITGDASCTNPAIPPTGVNFRNFLYSGANDDDRGEGLDRTREGYLEMIEMGELDPTVAPGSAAVHDDGVPDDCPSLRGVTVASVAGAITTPLGGLAGTGTLINVNSGADMGYNAVALADLTPQTGNTLYQDIGDDRPNWNDIDPVSAVISGSNAYRSDWLLAFPEDAVSSVFMHTDVINEYVLDNATLSNTDWVMTFPTKQYYVVQGAAAITPFTEDYDDGSCEPIDFTYFDREERGAAAADADFSPLPPSGVGASLCHEVTVLSIRNAGDHMPTGDTSGVLGSVNSSAVNIEGTFQNGWGRLTFTGANAVGSGLPTAGATSDTIDIGAATVTAGVDHIYQGLPVTGFMVRTFNNGTLTCGAGSCQGNYGAAFGHKYQQIIN